MEFTSIALSQEFDGQFYDFGIATTTADRFIYRDLNAAQAAELSRSSGIDVIVLLAGDDTATDDSSSRIYFGNTGNDTIDGADGNDTISAGQGDDVVIGGNGDDVLAGNLGRDTISGGSGNDVVLAVRNDAIEGGSGSDLLSGDLGDDTLTGGSGFDVLTGGDGRDRFVLEVGNNLDTITDFISGIDILQLPAGVSFSDLTFSTTSGNTLIQTTSGESIALLQGILPATISAANFVTADETAPTTTTLDTFEAEVLSLTNQFRQANGVSTLTANTNLSQAAETHSQNMANLDFFSHTGQDGSTAGDRAIAAGYDSTFVGENIGVGYSSPESVVQGWINSPGHRANLLNERYTGLGVGYVFLAEDTGNENWNHYWTQVFG
ncbi:MAG: serine protease [Coleofasciculaceae cyanobacterium RL_1_1]|nr:serine protease [Coleofasciculaceae cyanobacterium RL_1_1]